MAQDTAAGAFLRSPWVEHGVTGTRMVSGYSMESNHQKHQPLTYILGGGLAGISAGIHLKAPYALIERESRLGGLARTHERDGYRFDHTGHWLHLRDDYIKALVKRLLGDKLVEVERRARIHFQGRTTLYPFQANLNGLPESIVYECLLGFIEAYSAQQATTPSASTTSSKRTPSTRLSTKDFEPKNFEDYIYKHFGSGIAKHFMIPYNEKLWGVHPREITSAWCQRFVPVPSLEQVVAGAVGAGPANMGYNVRFLYPREGGIETLSRGLIAEVAQESVHLNTTIDYIDPGAQKLSINGRIEPYRAVISSIPLPHLVRAIRGAPQSVVDAASRLRATSVRYLNVATRSPSPADYHWVYVPEPHLPFYRVGVFSNAVPSLAPQGASSLYVELSTRTSGTGTGTGTETETEQSEIRLALQALSSIGAIRDVDDVRFAELRQIDPAYVIFDDHYQSATETIHDYLATCRIRSCGRYGAWIYNAMEDSLLAGKAAAEWADSLETELGDEK